VDLSSALQSLAARGFTPEGVGVQVPSEVGRPHDMQVPLQAVSQQNPSTQKPVPHCELQEQA
jgi:hypothetical protein